jgi:hypothetical protein
MSRYLDNPSVKIRLESIPPALRVLSPYFSKWDVYGGASRTEEINRARPDELAAFVAACRPLEAEMYDYAIGSCPEEGPVPDEVVLMQLLYHAYREAEASLPTGSPASPAPGRFRENWLVRFLAHPVLPLGARNGCSRSRWLWLSEALHHLVILFLGVAGWMYYVYLFLRPDELPAVVECMRSRHLNFLDWSLAYVAATLAPYAYLMEKYSNPKKHPSALILFCKEDRIGKLGVVGLLSLPWLAAWAFACQWLQEYTVMGVVALGGMLFITMIHLADVLRCVSGAARASRAPEPPAA